MRLTRCLTWITLLCLFCTTLPAFSEDTTLELPKYDAILDEIIVEAENALTLDMNDQAPEAPLILVDSIDLDPVSIDEDGADEAPNAIGFVVNDKVFPDPALRSAICAALGINEGDGVDSNTVLAAESFNFSNKGIQDLEGIQLFTELKELNLSSNPIVKVNQWRMPKLLSYLNCRNCTL